MSSEQQSYFQCADCGSRDRTDAIDYDQFGYAVCPVCGHRTRPSVSATS